LINGAVWFGYAFVGKSVDVYIAVSLKPVAGSNFFSFLKLLLLVAHDLNEMVYQVRAYLFGFANFVAFTIPGLCRFPMVSVLHLAFANWRCTPSTETPHQDGLTHALIMTKVTPPSP
jgi:hypothetical protein